jgi:hypothetical protein
MSKECLHIPGDLQPAENTGDPNWSYNGLVGIFTNAHGTPGIQKFVMFTGRNNNNSLNNLFVIPSYFEDGCGPNPSAPAFIAEDQKFLAKEVLKSFSKDGKGGYALANVPAQQPKNGDVMYINDKLEVVAYSQEP